METYYELDVDCEIKIYTGKTYAHRQTYNCEDMDEVNEELKLLRDSHACKILSYTITKCVVQREVIETFINNEGDVE